MAVEQPSDDVRDSDEGSVLETLSALLWVLKKRHDAGSDAWERYAAEAEAQGHAVLEALASGGGRGAAHAAVRRKAEELTYRPGEMAEDHRQFVEVAFDEFLRARLLPEPLDVEDDSGPEKMRSVEGGAL